MADSEWIRLPNTGRIYREPVADSYARYMYADRKGALILVHLTYGDGRRGRNLEITPTREILKRITQQEHLDTCLQKLAQEKAETND